MALTSGQIVALVTDTANAITKLNNTVTEIQTKFNAMLETSTGHSHDGTDSRAISSGVAGLTMEEYAVLRIMQGNYPY